MSSSLVRKALELFDDDLSAGPSSTKRNDDAKKFNSKKGKKKRKNMIEKFREKQNVKYTEKNLHLLQNIAESKGSNTEMLRKIILKSGMCSAQKLKSKQTKQKKQKSKSTVFDETDFQKFEKEYFS